MTYFRKKINFKKIIYQDKSGAERVREGAIGASHAIAALGVPEGKGAKGERVREGVMEHRDWVLKVKWSREGL